MKIILFFIVDICSFLINGLEIQNLKYSNILIYIQFQMFKEGRSKVFSIHEIIVKNLEKWFPLKK